MNLTKSEIRRFNRPKAKKGKGKQMVKKERILDRGRLEALIAVNRR